jgi:hypothetical protein
MFINFVTVYLCIHAIVLSIMLQDGATALRLAASWGKLEVAELLVRYGAAVDIRGKVITFRCLPLLAIAEHLSFRDS